MSLTPCRECAEQVSTEAKTCPHCGVTSPAVEPPLFASKDGMHVDYSNPVTYLLIIAVVVALAGGYFAYQHFAAGVRASGDQVEATIVERFQTINPKVTVYATCPSTVVLRKGKIVDCSIERSDNGKQTAVFITGTDNSGHFTMQMEDPSVLIDFP